MWYPKTVLKQSRRRFRRGSMSLGWSAFCGAAIIAPLLLMATTSSNAAISANTSACKATVLQASVPSNTTVTNATISSATAQTPQHCLVHATVATPGNRVEIVVALPTVWNEKFVFTPAAGFGGSLSLNSSALGRGYAVATSDTGHTGVGPNNGVRDATWALNAPAKMTDFGYRSMNVSTVATKAITVAYYAQSISRSIFSGCSGAGRLAMISAQRYPNDYDGYVVKAPAIDWVDLGVSQNHRAKAMFDTPDSWIPPAKYFVLGKAVLNACDALDGVVDGIVEDPRRCSFNPRSIQCKGADGADCLTGAQVEVVEKVVRGAVNSFGETLSSWVIVDGGGGQRCVLARLGRFGSVVLPHLRLTQTASPIRRSIKASRWFTTRVCWDISSFRIRRGTGRSFDLDTQFGLTRRARWRNERTRHEHYARCSTRSEDHSLTWLDRRGAQSLDNSSLLRSSCCAVWPGNNRGFHASVHGAWHAPLLGRR